MNIALKYLQSHAHYGFEAYGDPKRMSFMLLTPRFEASSRVVFLLFPEGQSDPVLVAKVPRLAGMDPGIQREAANLQIIHESRSGGFGSIPQVVAFEEFCGHQILIESALTGKPLDPPTVRLKPDEYCWMALDWLVELHATASKSGYRDTNWYERLVITPLEQFAACFPLDDDEQRLLEHTRELVTALRDAHLPLVVEHGDFSHPNILLLKSTQRFGVLDWDLAEIKGLPAIDLFFFLSYIAFSRQRASSNAQYIAAFQSAFFDANAWAVPYVMEYSERFNLKTDWLNPLFALGWLHYIVGLLSRLDRGTSPEGDVDFDTVTWLRENRYYKLWRYAIENIDRLEWDQ
jgi:aminoglycoside phosphotransferase